MALTTVQPSTVEMAVGQAAILLASEPSYFDTEFAPVMFRIMAAAEKRQIVFIQETDTRQIIAFASYGFLAPEVAFAWRHRMRAPSKADLDTPNGECWLLDMVYTSKEVLELLRRSIELKHQARAAVIKFTMLARSYPDYPVGTLKQVT